MSYHRPARILPVSSSYLINIEIFYAFLVHDETCLFLCWSTVLIKWELFSKALKSRKRGAGALWTGDCAAPALLRTVGFVRQEERLEFFVFFSYYGFIILSPLAVVWYYKQLEAHRKYNFMWNKKLLAFSPLILFHGGHSCTFVSCNCVNVLIFIKWPLIHWQPRLLWRYSVEAFWALHHFDATKARTPSCTQHVHIFV